MSQPSVLVSVLVLVDATNVESLRTIRDSFQRQKWPHKELIMVSRLPDDIADAHQVRIGPEDDWIAQGVKMAAGHICVLWTPGWWYHEDVLSIHARISDPWVTVELRHDLNEPCHSRSFFRRAVRFLEAPKMERRQIGAIGLVQRLEVTHDPTGWRLYHSGNTGDIIYSLPAMKVLGSGTYYMGPDILMSPKPEVREPMNKKLVENIAPLLLAQPYVKAVYFVERMPIVNYDLNLFRNFAGNSKHLMAQSLDACCLHAPTFFNDLTPWLDVDPIVTRHSVVVSRSHRWRNPEFPWPRILDEFRGKIVFVGTVEEHSSFIHDFERVPYLPTANLLELARVIAGCHLFVGNQSCPYSIAEGLKVNTIQETSPQLPNCMFHRPNAVYGRDKFVYIPGFAAWPDNPRRQRAKRRFFRRTEAVMSLTVVEKPKVFRKVYVSDGVSATVQSMTRSTSIATTHLFDVNRMLQAIPMPLPMRRNVIQWTLGRKGKVEAWFNPSLIQWKGNTLLAYRCECVPWFRLSMIAITKLDPDWHPVLESTVVPDLTSKFGNYCVEDPRFFVYKNELWLCYTDAHEVALAKLNDDLTTAKSFYLERPWQHGRPEKNWTFFEHEERMLAVYSLMPHRIVEVEGTQSKFVYESKWDPEWSWGELRGGSSPVLHNGLYWSFFHSSINIREESYGPIRQYLMGVYAFDSKPPFRPVLISKKPLLAGEEEQHQHDRPSQHYVVFPCGAMRIPQGWLVTFGDNDCRCRMAFFDDAIIDLKPI
jgi:predicted GH43/DUF377 family glycosyl hydrolase